MREDADGSFMVMHDEKKVVMDENFDYDPTRALDLIEMTNFELVGMGEYQNHAYPGAPSKFAFWKAAGEGLVSLGSGSAIWIQDDAISSSEPLFPIL